MTPPKALRPWALLSLWPRRFPLWSTLPAFPKSLSCCLPQPSLGFCHIGNPSETGCCQNRGPCGGSGEVSAGRGDTWQQGEMLGAGRKRGIQRRETGQCVQESKGPAPGTMGGPAQAWTCLVPSSCFDLERVITRSSCPQAPESGDRGLSHTRTPGNMCSLPSKLFLAFEESPPKHKCQVCSHKGP